MGAGLRSTTVVMMNQSAILKQPLSALTQQSITIDSISNLSEMYPTRFLQMRPTPFMMRPVPVSFDCPQSEERLSLISSRKRSTVVCNPTVRVLVDGLQGQCLTFKLRYSRICMADKLLSAAHTISQRLRTLKKIPPELIPLGKW